MKSKLLNVLIILNLITVSFLTAGLTLFEIDEDKQTFTDYNLPLLILSAGPGIPISNVTELQNMSSNLSATYYLINDIDCSEAAGWNGGLGFDPVGNTTAAFNGTFNGSGFRIYNLVINRSSTDYNGLFGLINSNSTIANLTIDSVIINGSMFTGSLVGYNDGGMITNVQSSGDINSTNAGTGGLVGYNIKGMILDSHSSGSVKGTTETGGLVGLNDNGNLTNSTSDADVDSTGNYTGGLVGRVNNGFINNCHSSGTVKSSGDSVGGLVGENIDGSVINSTNGGSVSGANRVGGLIGNNSYIVNSCSNTGNVTGTGNAIGGLVGNNSGPIDNSYSTGTVTGGGLYTGGFVGYNTGPLNNCDNYGDVTGGGGGGGVYTGGLVGFNKGTYINQSTSTARVDSDGYHVGGLVGFNDNAFINDCESNGDVYGDGLFVGGLVAYNKLSSISGTSHSGRVYNREKVTAGTATGGLVGKNTGIINNSYNFGDVNGQHSVGGLVGENTGSIIGTIATSSVTGRDNSNSPTGGLVGWNNGGMITKSTSFGTVLSIVCGGLVGLNNGPIDNSSSTSSVRGMTIVGGLVGENTNTIFDSFSAGYVGYILIIEYGGLIGKDSGGLVVNSFWDNQSSGLTTSNGGTSKNTSMMMNESTFTGAGWNFTSVWNITENVTYPFLRWHYWTAPTIISGTVYTNLGALEIGGGKQINISVKGESYITGTNNNSRYLLYFPAGSLELCDAILTYIARDNTNGNTLLLSDADSTTDLDILGYPDEGNIRVISDTAVRPVRSSDFTAAVGLQDNEDILFTSSGSDLTLRTGVDFLSEAKFELEGDIISSGGTSYINFSSPVTLAAGSVLQGTSIDFNSTVDGSFDLTVNGLITIRDNIGMSTATGTLDLNGAVDVINSDLSITSSKVIFRSTVTNSLGHLSINGDADIHDTVTTFFNQTWNGNVTLLNGNRVLTGTAVRIIGTMTNTGGGLTINGPVELSANITTKNAQVYNGAVTLIGDTGLDTGKDYSDIIFGSTIDGPYKLSLNSGAGDIILNDNVGNTIPPNEFRVVSAYNVTLFGLLYAVSFIQSSGTGTTDFSAGLVDLVFGKASITTKHAVGTIMVGSLYLGTDTCDLNGYIDGENGSAAVEKIFLIKAIRMNTNFFDGIDIFKFTPADMDTAIEDVMYEVDYEALYPEGELLTWSLETDAAFLAIDPLSGKLSGLPLNADVGVYWVNVTLTDEYDASTSRNFTLFVENTNDPPKIVSAPNLTAELGVFYIYDVEASDDDLQTPSGELLVFTLDQKPSGMEIDTLTGLIQWSPPKSEVGKKFNVIVNVTDGEEYILQSYLLTVTKENDPPNIISAEVTVATEDILYTYDVEAWDEDTQYYPDEILTYKLDASPFGMNIDSKTGLIMWTPTNAQAAQVYPVIVNVSDGESYDTQEFSITVLNVNNPPKIISLPSETAREDTLYNLDFDAEDIDPGPDNLTWKLSTAASWLKIDSMTGLLAGIPRNDDVGTNLVTVLVEDGNGGKDSVTFSIIVQNVNDPPVWAVIPEDQNITEGEPLLLAVQADDDDGDKISYSIKSEPQALMLTVDSKGTISWPSPVMGMYTITITATDNLITIMEQFRITVNKKDEPVVGPNTPPEIKNITPDQKAQAEAIYELRLSGTDSDLDDVITFGLDESPTGMVISSDGIIYWVPSDSQMGEHTVVVNLTDGRDFDTLTFNLTVEESVKPAPTKDDSDKVSRSALNASYAVIAVLAILLVLLILLMFMRSKSMKKAADIRASTGERVMVSKPVKEEEEEMFKCTECGTLIHLGDSECPECGTEFDEDDFDTAVDQEELEE
jgi:hypothetical protein